MSGDSRARRATRERFGEDARGQSETIAIVLILAMTVFGTGAIILLGSGALADAKETSRIQSTEHAMTLFDSTSAVVALGDSSSRTVDLSGSVQGTYDVRDSGWIRIEHVNFTGRGHNETIYNASLGSVAYVNGDTTIAYEGGGVWRREDGGSTMISPPEFHYREATLTLPVVRVHGSGSSPGGQVRIEKDGTTRRIYPNTTADTPGVNETGAPYDGTDWNYTNPVRNGEINVTVRSDYYQGWAEYFRTRTDGNVTVDPANRTATVQLVTVRNVGDFRMPNEGNGVKVRGMGSGHPVTDFRMTLQADSRGRNFNNLHWSLYSDEGDQEFEYHVHAKDKCKGGGEYDGTLDVSVYYHDGTSDTYQGWQNQSVDPSTNPDFSVDCDDYTLTMDLNGNTEMEYGEVTITGSDNKWYFGPEIESRSVPDSTTFDQHDDDADGNGPYGTGDTESLDFLIDHYFGLLGPRFDLTVADGPGGSSRVDEGTSYGRLEYEQTTGSRYITFLHITENEVRVELR